MDTKLNRILAIAAFQIIFGFSLVKAQEFRLQSLDGKNVEIQLHTNDAKHVLSITCNQDTAYIADVEDIKKVELLDKNFLSVVYGLRGGTGLSVAGTSILSVCNNNIYQSLNIISAFNEEFLDFSKNVTPPMKVTIKSSYEVKLFLSPNNGNSYTINAKIHDERHSSDPKENNYSRYLVSTLIFDHIRNVFYNFKERLSGYYMISDKKSPKDFRKYIKGDFLVAKLGSYKYYYIGDVWYERSDKNHLTKSNFR